MTSPVSGWMALSTMRLASHNVRDSEGVSVAVDVDVVDVDVVDVDTTTGDGVILAVARSSSAFTRLCREARTVSSVCSKSAGSQASSMRAKRPEKVDWSNRSAFALLLATPVYGRQVSAVAISTAWAAAPTTPTPAMAARRLAPMGTGDDDDELEEAFEEAFAEAFAFALLAADGGGGTCDCSVDLKRWWHEFEGSLRLRMRDDCRAAEVVEERMAIMIGRLFGCLVALYIILNSVVLVAPVVTDDCKLCFVGLYIVEIDLFCFGLVWFDGLLDYGEEESSRAESS